MIGDQALLQAASLRVSWDERDVDGMLRQVINIVNVGSADEVKDLIIALTISGNTPVGMFRNTLSNGF